ncbi:MAG: hypothetical protein J6Q48_09755 [Bacteroidaceae bacterium]|nr:hypothetical protein [Bacteroidaceae bacterium]
MALNGNTKALTTRSWKSSTPTTNKRYQRVLRLWTKVLRRIMLHYGMGYVDVTVIDDDYCNVTSKAGSPTEGDYVVNDHWN